jgi:hypothetical protein
MHEILRMQMVYTEAYMDEDFPNKVLSQLLASLLLLVCRQVLILTVLHHYIEFGVVDVAVNVAHNEVRVYRLENFYLVKKVFLLLFTHLFRLYFLHHVVLASLQPSQLIQLINICLHIHRIRQVPFNLLLYVSSNLHSSRLLPRCQHRRDQALRHKDFPVRTLPYLLLEFKMTAAHID